MIHEILFSLNSGRQISALFLLFMVLMQICDTNGLTYIRQNLVSGEVVEYSGHG